MRRGAPHFLLVMKQWLGREWRSFLHAVRSLDVQTACVLILCALFVIGQFKLGSRGFFRSHVAPNADELLSWGWWFGMQGMTGFLLPAATLLLFFRRRPSEIGLGTGDWKLACSVGVLFAPIVAAGAWVLSDGAAFQAEYPHYRPAVQDWELFFLYHLLFLFYWIGWEYLWRGFLLFGTAHTLGVYAIFVQAMPFALLHLRKPAPELMLSIVGGLALGALVWRCRSFWIAVPIHAMQMFAIDFWCSLRLRTGVSGIGPDALLSLLKTWLGDA